MGTAGRRILRRAVQASRRRMSHRARTRQALQPGEENVAEIITMTGRLSVIMGPMFAGKSTELIDRLDTAQNQGMNVQAFRPVRDTRDGAARAVITHDGARWPALRVHHASEILERIHADTHVVGIDEVNMLAEGIAHVCIELVKRDIWVLVSGLNLDYRAKPFAPMPELLCFATDVTVRQARCTCCGVGASFSQRIVASEELILPGGGDAYEPRCVRCYIPEEMLDEQVA